MRLKNLLPYIISLLLLVAVLIVNSKTFSEMNEYTVLVDHTRIVINSLEKLSNHLKSAEIYTPRYAAAHQKFYVLYKREAESIPSEITALKQLVKDNPGQTARIDTIRSLIMQQMKTLLNKNIAEIIQSGEAWRLDVLFRVHELINIADEEEEKLLNQRKESLAKLRKTNRMFTIGFSIIALALTLSTFIYNAVLVRRRKWLEGFLESILNTSTNCIIHYTTVREHGSVTDFKIAFANATLEKQFGIKPAEVLGKKLKELDSYVRDTDVFNKYVQVVETGNPHEFDMFYDRNGKKAWFYVMLAKMEDGLTATLQNITEIRQYQDDLRKNIQQLEHSNSELEQYAYIASHDLQEPLRKIKIYGTFLQEMQRSRMDDKGKMHLDKIIQAAERLSNLIRDILNFSSLKRDPSFVKTDLNKVLANVIEDIDLTIEQKAAIIENDKLPEIEAIPLQINQLFYNLLINALKFTKKDIRPVISIRSRLLTPDEVSTYNNLNNKKPYCEIVFTDNGIGFNQSFATQIFGLFKRLNEQKSYPGSGIGLALCGKVVANHNGEIHAVSNEGEGASFYIILPLKQ